MPDHSPLPIHGYTNQPESKVALVNLHKKMEENILRHLDSISGPGESMIPDIDRRWLAIARTKLEESFMALNRAVFKPGRVELEGE